MHLIKLHIFLFIYSFGFCLVSSGQESSLQSFIAQHAKELDTNSQDFKGMAFLDTLLKDKRIVLLGESSHGTEEYSRVKLQLIQYLHSKLGFNVVLFESPATPGSYFNIGKDSVSGADLVVNSIQYVWHTKTVARLFDYIKESGMQFGGVDPQFIPSAYSSRFFSSAFANNPDIKNELLVLENRIRETFLSGKEYEKLKDSFSAAYAGLLSKLEKPMPSPLQEWARHIIQINVRYYANLNKGNERDSCMAKNAIWLTEKMYPNEKIIIWAHNSHIDKNSSSSARFMGKLVASHFGEQVYAVGLYMMNGNTAQNNRSVTRVEKPLRNSLEQLLGAKGYISTFIETSNEVFNRKIPTYHWGNHKQLLNLSKSYDAVILINGVSVPEYLKE